MGREKKGAFIYVREESYEMVTDAQFTDEKILAICGRDTQSIVREPEKLLLEELSVYDPSELRQRLSIYERCDKRIRECL